MLGFWVRHIVKLVHELMKEQPFGSFANVRGGLGFFLYKFRPHFETEWSWSLHCCYTGH